MGKRGPKPKFNDVACTNTKCKHYGKTGTGNIVGNGTYQTQNGRVRKLICRTCGGVFNDRDATFFYNLRTPEEKVITAMKLLLKGMSLRAIADVLGVKLDTVRGWLHRGAEHVEEINDILMKEANVSKVELDELWTFVKKKRFRKWQMEKMKDTGYG
jgi:transposase-like protein